MPWQPTYEGEKPTLGWQVIDWITEYLVRPDVPDLEPLIPIPEQEDFFLKFYELDPETGKRKIARGVISRPRGWGKSPYAAMYAWVEALGPVRFAGWDADGQPVGAPWSYWRAPLVQIAAVSEDQTKNTWEAVQDMSVGDNLHDDHPGLEVMGGFINLPRGRIETISASARSVKGARAVAGVMDQTEVWTPSSGGVELASVMRSNAAKLGGSTLETPNAFIPGLNSVAEQSATFAQMIEEGTARDPSLLWDHREAPADTDLGDEESLEWGLRVAYGDASAHPDGCVLHDPPCHVGWVDLDPLKSRIYDPNTDPQVSRSDFLNQITHASDAWLSHYEVGAIIDRGRKVKPGDAIVLGFDGSAGRKRGNPDATALVGMRVADRHLFEIGIWERRANDPQDWEPDMLDINATIQACFDQFNVLGFYADPSGWTPQVAEWEAKYGRKLKVRASGRSPIKAWPRGKDSRVTEWVDQLYQAIVLQEVTLSDTPALIRHLTNARRRQKRTGYLLYKEYPDSPNKIDGAYAAMLAYRACMDAVASNAIPKERTRKKIGVF